jgi:hypothetical protein
MKLYDPAYELLNVPSTHEGRQLFQARNKNLGYLFQEIIMTETEHT